MALCKGQHFILLLLCIPTQIRGFLRVARLGGGVLHFSPLAFETLGSRHSGSLLECLDSEQRCKGVTVGQGEHNTNVQKDDQKNQFSFPGPLHKEIYFSLHSPLQGARERTQCSGMALIQLFWEAHYLKYVFHPCSTAQS